MTIYTDEERQKALDWFARKKGSSRPKTVIKQLSEKQGLSFLKAQQILQDLMDDGLIKSSKGSIRYGTLAYAGSAEMPEHELRWRKVLGSDPEQLMLQPCHQALADWEVGQLQKLLKGLIDLRSNLPAAYQLTKYEASARYLLSSSKLLDNLGKASLRQFGINLDRFKQATTHVVIAGPAEPEQVLLIENPQSFEACINAGLHQHMAMVSTHGYGLQWKQVPENQDSVVGIVRLGCPDQNLTHLLSHPKLFFWGDLDYAGIDIYQSIRSGHAQCLLSNLYQPMIERLRSGLGHSYSEAAEKKSRPAKIICQGWILRLTRKVYVWMTLFNTAKVALAWKLSLKCLTERIKGLILFATD